MKASNLFWPCRSRAPTCCVKSASRTPWNRRPSTKTAWSNGGATRVRSGRPQIPRNRLKANCRSTSSCSSSLRAKVWSSRPRKALVCPHSLNCTWSRVTTNAGLTVLARSRTVFGRAATFSWLKRKSNSLATTSVHPNLTTTLRLPSRDASISTNLLKRKSELIIEIFEISEINKFENLNEFKNTKDIKLRNIWA